MFTFCFLSCIAMKLPSPKIICRTIKAIFKILKKNIFMKFFNFIGSIFEALQPCLQTFQLLSRKQEKNAELHKELATITQVPKKIWVRNNFTMKIIYKICLLNKRIRKEQVSRMRVGGISISIMFLKWKKDCAIDFRKGANSLCNNSS